MGRTLHISGKELLEWGADTQAKDIDGKTALIRASSNGHQEVVELLTAAEE